MSSSSSSSSMSNRNNNNDCHRKEGMSSREESVTQIQTSTTTTNTTQNTVSSGGSSTQDAVTPAAPSVAAASTQGVSKLTPEQLERIRINRERALKIRAERKRQQQEQAMAARAAVADPVVVGGGSSEPPHKKLKAGDAAHSRSTVPGTSSSETRTAPEIMEDWEVGLSDFVTKKEAVAKYCLPEGTLAVCQVTKKENPHHKGWAPMKLYHRSELRERAYRRFGGKEGLIQERQKRENRRLAKDLKDADNIFA